MSEVSHYEYAVRLNCAKNGCVEPHSDDGKILHLLEEEQANLEKPYFVNDHATSYVRRTIGEWQDVEANAVML